MSKHNTLFFCLKFNNKIKSLLCLLPFLFIFFTCKKTNNPDSSASNIKYLQGGAQDRVQSVIKTRDGGFLYLGYTTNASNTDGFMLKVDAAGKQQWYKTYGGAGFDFFKNAVSTSDGGFLAVGASNSASFDTINQSFMGFMVRTDADGNVKWQKNLATYYSTKFYTVIENPETNGFLISGSVFINNAIVCLYSIGPDGNTLFYRSYGNSTFGSVPPMFLNNLYTMVGTSIHLTNDASGTILLGGVSSKSSTASETATFLTHIFSVGKNGLPVKNYYRFTEFENFGYLYSYNIMNPIARIYPTVPMIKLNDGYLIATYTLDTPNYGQVMQLIRTDLNANIENPIWHKEFDGLGNSILYDMNDNGDGTYLLTGTSSLSGADLAYPELFNGLKTMVVKVDKDGNVIWENYQGSAENANVGMCSQALADGGYAMAGYNSSNKSGFHKMFYMKLDKDGKIAGTK